MTSLGCVTFVAVFCVLLSQSEGGIVTSATTTAASSPATSPTVTAAASSSAAPQPTVTVTSAASSTAAPQPTVTVTTAQTTTASQPLPGPAQPQQRGDLGDAIRSFFRGFRRGMGRLINELTSGSDTNAAETTTTPSVSTSTSTSETSTSTATAAGSVSTVTATAPSSATVTSPSVTTASVTSATSPTTASSQRGSQTICPDGTYDKRRNTVEFLLEDKECIITVYLHKGPKRSKEPKGKGPKGRKGPKGNRDHGKKKPKGKGEKDAIFDAEATPRFGAKADMCPLLKTQMFGKKTFILETDTCVMFISKEGRDARVISRPLGT